MILSEFIDIKINIYNKSYYEKLGYDINSDIIKIKISDLSYGSNFKILVKCDYCNNVKEVSYKSYNKSIKKNGKFSCNSKECNVLKLKECNLLKYGVETSFERDDVKNKIKETNLEKYGVEHVSKRNDIKDRKKIKYNNNKDYIKNKIKESWRNKSNEEKNKINDKREKTVIEKYGASNVSKNNDIKKKKKNTFLNKFGGFTLESKELSAKVNSTLFKKYGTTKIASNKDIQDKIKKTNIDRYGCERPTQNENIKNKIKNTFKKLYNVDNIMFSEEFRKYNYIIAKDSNYLRYVGGQISEFKCDCGEDHIFEIDTSNYFKRKERFCKLCTKCYPIDKNVSIKEKELFKFISSIYNGTIIENYRDSYEIDIYLPELKLGFEFNGLYWHSDKYIENDKHINKLKYFKEKDIRIIYIWEDDWNLRKNIIKSQIKNWLKICDNKIFARKCNIKEITDSKLVKDFLNENHVQGFIHSVKKIGLFHNNELISIMTFDKFEGRKKLNDNEWNLSRFCNKININVAGSASKLLSYFIKTNECKRIVSYADQCWSDGNLYYKLGFNKVRETKISYKYIINNKRENKQKFTKKKIKYKFNIHENLTEKEIMKKMNINRVYDCGQLKFELIM